MSDTPERDTNAKQKARYSDVVSGVFGLILGLSAFTLTDIPLDAPVDMWEALGVFAPSFFFVLLTWRITAELSDRYPDGDPPFYVAVTAVLFLTTLAPVFLNLLLSQQPDVQRLSARLFPLSLAAVYAILAVLWARLGLLIRRAGQAPEPAVRAGVAIELALALFFLATLLLPYDADGTSPRTLAWLGAFVIPHAIPWLIARMMAARR